METRRTFGHLAVIDQLALFSRILTMQQAEFSHRMALQQMNQFLHNAHSVLGQAPGEVIYPWMLDNGLDEVLALFETTRTALLFARANANLCGLCVRWIDDCKNRQWVHEDDRHMFCSKRCAKRYNQLPLDFVPQGKHIPTPPIGSRMLKSTDASGRQPVPTYYL